MDFLITITTYRRQKPLQRLLNQIEDQKGKYKIKCIVVMDGVDYNIEWPSWCEPHLVPHHGRQNWFKLINVMWDWCKRERFLYYYSLQDDVTICDNFFEKSVTLYTKIKDRNKIVMDLRRDGRSQLWGAPLPEFYEGYFKSQWFDMIFMADNFFFENLPPLEYQATPQSSGVARQLTKRFRKRGFNMYHVYHTMVHHGHEESLMNPEERKKNKLIC